VARAVTEWHRTYNIWYWLLIEILLRTWERRPRTRYWCKRYNPLRRAFRTRVPVRADVPRPLAPAGPSPHRTPPPLRSAPRRAEAEIRSPPQRSSALGGPGHARPRRAPAAASGRRQLAHGRPAAGARRAGGCGLDAGRPYGSRDARCRVPLAVPAVRTETGQQGYSTAIPIRYSYCVRYSVYICVVGAHAHAVDGRTLRSTAATSTRLHSSRQHEDS
jgi:hypothetical protein